MVLLESYIQNVQNLSHYPEAVARSRFVKFIRLRPAALLKKRLWHRCFPVNFQKFLRTPFLTEHQATAAEYLLKIK